MGRSCILLGCLLLVGCTADTSSEQSQTREDERETPRPSPAREVPPSRPLAQAAPPSGDRPAGCQDPVLVRAFEALSSCDYRGGIIDQHCPAFVALKRVISEREAESQALVQLTLMGLLDHTEERVRLAVAKSLSTYAQQGSVTHRLAETYHQETIPEVRTWIVYALHGATPEARALILQALQKDPSPEVRAKAAQRLSLAHFLREPEVRGALVNALQKDPSEKVRWRAAESLGRAAGDVKVEQALLACLPLPEVGPHCALGLGHLGAEAGYHALVDVVQRGVERHSVPPLVLLGLVELATRPFFSETMVIPLLHAVARDERMVPGARHYAVKALGRVGRELPRACRAVMDLLGPLANDTMLGASVVPELEQLRAALTPSRSQR